MELALFDDTPNNILSAEHMPFYQPDIVSECSRVEEAALGYSLSYFGSTNAIFDGYFVRFTSTTREVASREC